MPLICIEVSSCSTVYCNCNQGCLNICPLPTFIISPNKTVEHCFYLLMICLQSAGVSEQSPLSSFSSVSNRHKVKSSRTCFLAELTRKSLSDPPLSLSCTHTHTHTHTNNVKRIVPEASKSRSRATLNV